MASLPGSKAQLKVSMESLRELPALSVFTLKEGVARATIERQTDTLVVSAECDSVLQLLYEKESELEYHRKTRTEQQISGSGYSLFHLIAYCLLFLLAGALAGWVISKFM